MEQLNSVLDCFVYVSVCARMHVCQALAYFVQGFETSLLLLDMCLLQSSNFFSLLNVDTFIVISANKNCIFLQILVVCKIMKSLQEPAGREGGGEFKYIFLYH